MSTVCDNVIVLDYLSHAYPYGGSRPAPISRLPKLRFTGYAFSCLLQGSLATVNMNARRANLAPQFYLQQVETHKRL